MKPSHAEEGFDRDENFERFRQILRARFGSAIYASWFSDLELDEATADSVTVSTESAIRLDRLDQQYKAALKRAWCEGNYAISRFLIVKRPALRESARRVAEKTASSWPSSPLKPLPFAPRGEAGVGARSDRRAPRLEELATPLDPRQTFETFAIDAANAMAHAAAQRIFQPEAQREILYIYGPSGAGKTHLLQACGARWRERDPNARCVYLTHANIVSGCVGAVLSNSIFSLQQDLLTNELVLIDDIHLLGGKARTVNETFNLISALASAGRQIIVSGDRAPGRLAEAGIHGRLADRLSEGLPVPVSAGGEALRREVLKKRLAIGKQACTLSDEAVELIARLFGGSLRECIGALNQALLVYGGEAREISAEEVFGVLKPRLGERRRTISLDEAMAAAAAAFGLTVDDLKGKAQPQRIVRARHAFVYVARRDLNESYPRIGAALNRDHTTSISSYRRAEALLERDQAFRLAVAQIRASLGF